MSGHPMPGAASTPLRVASVPAAHPYVTHLGLGAAGIAVLRDPVPPGAPPGRWWPPVMLDAAWISGHRDEFDVLHIHFGAESLSIDALSRALAALAEARRPLVFTVHDLENPQLAHQAHHLAQLDLLIGHAAELVTLTAGAAAEITRRWGRTPTVIPHPRMLAADQEIPVHPTASTAFTVGLHLRDLRPSIDGPGVAHGLTGAITELRAAGIDARARIVVFDHVRDPDELDRVRAAVATSPHTTLVQQPRASDAELVVDLSRLDVSLLPYRHGTHSGWAELCWDLGVPVAGAAVGYVAEQHAEPGWFAGCDPSDAASLARAFMGPGMVAQSHSPARRRARVAARRARRDRDQPGLAEAHRAVYLRALGR